MNRRYFLHTGLAALSATLPILKSCAQPPESPLRVGTIIWPGYEPLFLARDLGYYQKTPIELREYPSATEVSQALRNGDLEAAALTLDETLLMAETNPDVQVILVMDFSSGADVVMAKPEIKSLSELKGRRIGAESSALGGYMLTRMLNTAGLSVQDVQVVPVGASEHEQAYKQNLVDAVVTFEPVRTNLLKVGAKIVFNSSQIPGEIIDCLAVLQGTLSQRQSDLENLLSGWFKALEYNQKNPLDAAKRMALREQVSAEQFMDSLKLITIPDLETNLKLLTQSDPTLLQTTKRLSQVMLDKKLINVEVPIESLLNAQIVQAVQDSHQK